MADYVVRLNGQDNLSGTINKVKNELNDFGKVGATASEKIDAKFQRIINSSAPLKRQLKDLQALMGQMNFDGLSNTEQFTKIAQAAGQMKNAIADAGTAVQKYAGDTMALQASIQAFQGLAAAGSVATGTMALFGGESEDAAKAIQKVQGALAILNGVQAVANTLNKDSALMLKLKQVRLAANTVATTTNTVATTTNTAGVVANTTATIVNTNANKAWNITKAIGKALLGDWTGLLIVGAGALAAYAVATSDSADEQKKLNGELTIGKSFEEMVNDARKQGLSSISEEKNRIEGLQRVVDSTNTSYADKVKAINQLKSIVPSYNATISAEGVVHSNAASAIRNHIAALDDLQKALAAFKVGQQIQDELSQADFNKFLADDKLRRKQNNMKADQREIDKQRGRQTPLAVLGYDSRTQTNITNSRELTAAEGRLRINTKAAQAAATEQKAADLDLQTAQRKKTQYDKWVTTQGSTKAQTAVSLAGGNADKALDIFLGRDNIANGSGTRSGGKSGGKTGGGGGVTQAQKDAEELVKYQTTLNNLEEQFNNKLITELDYRTKVRDAEKAHLQYLFSANKASSVDVKKYELSESALKSTTIRINYESNIEELDKQLQDGFISSTEYAEGLANQLKQVYLENLKIGEATKEMAEEYLIAKNKAELLRKSASFDVNQKYSKNQSSFDKATQTDKAQTFDNQLSELKEQMDFNDDLISQMTELIGLYEQLGLTGSNAYQAINSKLNQTIEENSNLGKQASDLRGKQIAWEDKQKKVDAYAESISELGSVFSGLGNAMGESNAAWLNFAAQALEGTAKIIPIIQKLILAKQAEAIASGTAEGAKMPYPLNIAAILSVVATIASVFASLPKFANGGIVAGGSTHGDRVIARLNQGEMVLNGRQQSNLFKAIQNGDLGTEATEVPTINFRLKGSDIYGSLRNYGKGQIKVGKNIGIS